MSDGVQDKAADVLEVATDRATLYAVGAALVENVAERALFKALPQYFGFASSDGQGGVRFNPAKINPAGTGGGKPTWVAQTAVSTTPLYFRQGARAVMGAAGFLVALSTKDRAVKSAGLSFGVLAVAHIVQDFIPPLRG